LNAAIAIDAMGGDQAPREVVKGAILAARHLPEVPLLLVGKEEQVRAELDLAHWKGESLRVIPAEHVIEMGDSPVEALRRKRGSSIEEAVRLVREGQASAVVSAGNTGACVAASTILLGHLPRVKRAGIAVAFYAGHRPVVVIDVGANVAAKPEHLMQYGIMASLYAREILGVDNPRVGLLNVGEEDEKGNRLAKETYGLFQRTSLNFVGNIEGVEIFQGACDVVVCDGFTGNIVLKVSEGLAERLVALFKTVLERSVAEVAGEMGVGGEMGLPEEAGFTAEAGFAEEGGFAKGKGASLKSAGRAGGSGGKAVVESELLGLGKLENLLRRSLGALHERLDYAEYGGAPLLGAKGVVIIAHGRSDSKAIFNAIRAAKRMSELDINRHISEELRAFSEQRVS
jgi:glycerol-3-phosphate acyltransferase PlsX